MIILAYVLSGFSLLMSFLFIIKPKAGLGIIVWIPKLVSGALSPYLAVIGAVGALLGWVYDAPWAVAVGILGAGMMISYIWRCTRYHNKFEQAFGAEWSNQIPPEQARRLIKKRWTWFLKMKTTPEPNWERDIPFWTIPNSDQQLCCDVWYPADGNVSGLAFIYFHGGGWSIGEKDMLTRPFFRHLVAQGHTVMDVSYRLFPKVDIFSILGDVKRSIAWMKANASRFGVSPEKIVLGGGSAGGHLALLAGYTPELPELTPDELKNVDLSVCGIVSHYGPADLLSMYEYTNYRPALPTTVVPIGPDSSLNKRDAGRLDILLGGRPEDIHEIYQFVSPITHVHPDCPPTLLFHGNQDILVPVDATNALYEKLIDTGVPAINIIFPWTNHGFDLLLPQVSPSAQSALYDVDRFLAFLINKGDK